MAVHPLLPSSVSSRSASCRLSSFVHPLRVSFTPIPFAAQRPGPGPVPSGPGPGVPPAGSERVNEESTERTTEARKRRRE